MVAFSFEGDEKPAYNVPGFKEKKTVERLPQHGTCMSIVNASDSFRFTADNFPLSVGKYGDKMGGN